MLHLAEITEIHENDAYFDTGIVNPGEVILWIERKTNDGIECGQALRKNGHKAIFCAIKTRRLN